MSQDMHDFSREKSEVLKFRIDEDIFEAFAEVGAELLLGVTETAPMLVNESSTQEEIKAFNKWSYEYNLRCIRFVQECLLPSSRERFAERMKSSSDPISLKQVTDVFRVLVQTYSGRPTPPPSPSTPGPGGIGTSLTDTARIVDLTPDSSQLPGSLT